MSWASDAVDAVRKLVVVEERVTVLSEQVKALAHHCEDLRQRVAHLEGKFELLEHLGNSRRRRLPPS
jgi:ubiquinone biosynthesis protein UbiJ